MILGRIGAAAPGARRLKPGLVGQADRGTLYLTGLDALGEKLGSALARVLRRGLYRPLGGRRELEVDLRLILATSPDLSGGGKMDGFLKGMARTVGQMRLELPPLRERPEDIPALAAQLLGEVTRETQSTRRFSFTPESIERLQQQHWPDNVRQLKQAIRQALRETGGNKSEAAKLLGVHRNRLNLKLKRMKIRP